MSPVERQLDVRNDTGRMVQTNLLATFDQLNIGDTMKVISSASLSWFERKLRLHRRDQFKWSEEQDKDTGSYLTHIERIRYSI